MLLAKQLKLVRRGLALQRSLSTSTTSVESSSLASTPPTPSTYVSDEDSKNTPQKSLQDMLERESPPVETAALLDQPEVDQQPDVDAIREELEASIRLELETKMKAEMALARELAEADELALKIQAEEAEKTLQAEDDKKWKQVKVEDLEQKDVTEEDMASIYGIEPRIVSRLHKMGIKKLFPVQKASIEACRRGEDLVVRSKTGSGKTVAFALPAIEAIYAAKNAPDYQWAEGRPLCVVVAPTRELALQVQKEFSRLAPDLSCMSMYGGAPIGPQLGKLRDEVDVLVGTPGRMMDHIKRGSVDMSHVRIAILDEADEMLKVGFIDDVKTIYSSMPPQADRQNLLFSATMERRVRSVAQDLMNEPKFVDLVGKDTDKIPDTIDMQSMMVNWQSRPEALSMLLKKYIRPGGEFSGKRALVFINQKRTVDDLVTNAVLAENG